MKSEKINPTARATHVRTGSIRAAGLMAIMAGTLVLVPAALCVLAACSTDSLPPPAEGKSAVAFQEGVPGGVIVNTLDVSARVTAIDKDTRNVTLMGPEGDKCTVKMGPEVVNFDQIRVGDLVKATLTEQVVVSLDEKGAPASGGTVAVVARAPKGAQPAGLVAGTTQVAATIVALDRTKRTATLRFEDGTTKTFPVRDDIDLSRHTAGERMVFRVTEMIAVTLEKE